MWKYGSFLLPIGLLIVVGCGNPKQSGSQDSVVVPAPAQDSRDKGLEAKKDATDKGDDGDVDSVKEAFQETGKGFKKAGTEMEKGFKKVGQETKEFFVGEDDDKK